MFIPFIDVLYSLAIGIGFDHFPANPLDDMVGTFTFFFTLFVAAHDWYEYHDKIEKIPKRKELRYQIWQVFVILVLNQMFRHSVSPSLQTWLFYLAVFSALNAVWNVITKYRFHWFFAGGTIIYSLLNLLAGFYYFQIISIVPSGADGRIVVLIGEIIWGILFLVIAYVLDNDGLIRMTSKKHSAHR